MKTRAEAIAVLTAVDQEYEVVAGESWGRPCRLFKNVPNNLRELFESSRSDETFIVYEDERLTFDETQRKVARIANILVTQYGVKKGDRVAISMRNYPEWIMAFNAITSIGSIAVAMNSLWQSEEMEFGLRDSGAKVLFADDERVRRLTPINANLDIEVIAVRVEELPSGNFRHLDDLLSEELGESLPYIEIAPGDPATILYTSGSTGHPKGALSSHLNILSALMSWELEAKISLYMSGEAPPDLPYQSATLLAVPLFHATGSHA
ncbi:MAG TPA: fatty acid--CoA ligase, partial [Gammaproteobacteria bacterium]|nr:fatty acid--CoA ligase [Gammaproteobacteria bacterium]